jgi:lipopolysaccharide/colanic/teichoic acid biosynthesis glycosyltransferase
MKYRFKPRTSTDVPWINLSTLDLLWGILAPVLALWLRDPNLLSTQQLNDSFIYVFISAVFTSICFVWFRLSHSVSRFFSVNDAMMVIKASAIAVSSTAVACFLLTRLDNIPRSVPIIHFMVLVAGNIAGRANRYLRRRQRDRVAFSGKPTENILIVGVSDLSWFYIQIIEEFCADVYHVVALIDDSRSLQGRFVHGYPVAGRIQDLERVLDEYEVHGVSIHRIVLAFEPNALGTEQTDVLSRAARQRNIVLEILPERLGLAGHGTAEAEPEQETRPPRLETAPRFWRLKRWFDLGTSLIVLCVTAPLAVIIVLLVLIDCGMPVMFWQVRVGQYGRRITVSKFRTLRAPYDSRGDLIPAEGRASRIGRLIRFTHLDELPQLLSVVIGDMSLVGPRPLLPIDLAKRTGLRFAVRPGITGWAQVNGATLLTAEEKAAMDEWYVRHASWRLDFLIVLYTIRTVFLGMRRNEAAIVAALAEQRSLERIGTSGESHGRSRPDVARADQMIGGSA